MWAGWFSAKCWSRWIFLEWRSLLQLCFSPRALRGKGRLALHPSDELLISSFDFVKFRANQMFTRLFSQQVALQLVELGHVRWAWMGVFLADLSPEVAAKVGLPIREGVIIQDMLVDGPSDRAGIHPGDIVVNIDGHDIATVSDLTRLLKQEFKAGQEVEVEVFRVVDGQSSTKMLVLKLGERPQQ